MEIKLDDIFLANVATGLPSTCVLPSKGPTALPIMLLLYSCNYYERKGWMSFGTEVLKK